MSDYYQTKLLEQIAEDMRALRLMTEDEYRKKNGAKNDDKSRPE